MKKAFLLIALTGCLNYHPKMPDIPIPETWKEVTTEELSFSEKNRFWEFFEDPVLNQLENEALAGNFDLQIAASRIENARALVMKDHAQRLPKVDLNVSATQDETLLNPRSFGSPTNHLERVKQEQYSMIGAFSYEADLWGKFKAKEKSARSNLQASKWEHEFIYQTLVADVAISYFNLRSFEAQIAVLEEGIFLWKDKIDLIKSRVEAGLEPEIDLAKAQLELALVEGEAQSAKRDRALEENKLAALVGKPASSFKVAPGKLPENVPPLPNILPSQILLRRADIQSALSFVSAGRYDVSVALKNYFPSFPLTGNLGLSSPLLSHFFEWQARYWGYALNAIEPLFDGGRRKADVKQAKARFNESVSIYQKTVNQAFQDVEDALSTLHYKNLQMEAQTRACLAAADTFTLSEEQFKSGLISYLLVADAKNRSIAVERKKAALKGEELTAWVQVLKALGIQ